jgi:DNA-binding protein H-NS
MPKVNLSGMTVEALMDLRKRVEARLVEHRAQLEKQLERMGRAIAGPRIVRGGRSILKGRKVPPKYRGPSGETWAGRGARPRWLVAAIKGGKKLWPAPGSEDTELGVLMEPEVGHGETEVYPRVQA